MGLWHKLLDLIYPRRYQVCLNCGQTIDTEEVQGLCRNCLENIVYLNNYCQYCGRAIPKGSKLCHQCQDGAFNFEFARSVGVYDQSLRRMIIRLKYEGISELKGPLGEIMTLYFNKYFGKIGLDFILPIPLHPARKVERGFNQAGFIASEISRNTGIPWLENLLVRVKDSPPLYELSRYERKEVLKDCFQLVHKDKLSSCKVLLVDDIFTTGATVNEASRILKEEGRVKAVYVFTLATGRADGILTSS